VADELLASKTVLLRGKLARREDPRVRAVDSSGTDYVFLRVGLEKIDYGEESATLITFQDETQNVECLLQQKAFFEEENKSESIQSYISTIQHEFKTPLATVVMFIESLLTLIED
jgi:signal transduction histidine kinase